MLLMILLSVDSWHFIYIVIFALNILEISLAKEELALYFTFLKQGINMKLFLSILLISSPAFSVSSSTNENIPVPAIALVSEAACIRTYSVKEHTACIKLVESSIVKAYWAGKMRQFCRSPFNKSAGKDRQCREVKMLSRALDEMSSRYLEE